MFDIIQLYLVQVSIIFHDTFSVSNFPSLQVLSRKGESIYRIGCIEDDCETWYTTLINVDTNEKFQELDFPHDIFHDVGDYVKYENGQYSIVPGTSIYEKDPYFYEFCERDLCYHTRLGKIHESVWMNYNLESLFNKAKDGEKNWFKDVKLKAQIFVAKIANRFTKQLSQVLL